MRSDENSALIVRALFSRYSKAVPRRQISGASAA